MNDFSFQKNIENFYSYTTHIKETELSNNSVYFSTNELEQIFSILYSDCIKQKSRFIDGFYPIEESSQRWMSKNGLVIIDVPADVKYFFLRGYFPSGFYLEETLKLSVFVDDSLMGIININKENNFTGTIPINDSLLKKPRKSVLIKIIALNSFVPSNYDSKSSDFRELSMLIHSIGFVDSIESILNIEKQKPILSQIEQPFHPYFKGNCNICGAESFFILDNYLMHRESFLCDSCRATNRNRQIANGLLKYFQKRGLASTCINDLAKELEGKDFTIYDTDSNYYVANLLKKYSGYITSDYREDMNLGTLLGKNHYCQDLSNLTFEDNSFDVVISSDVFEHIRLYKQAIKEISRVLKSGGSYIFTVPFNSKVDEHQTYIDVIDENDPSKDIELKPLVFHGDTITNRGTLLYRIYGKKIFREFEDAGFLVEYERTTIPSLGIYDCDLFVAHKPSKVSENKYLEPQNKVQYNECKLLNIEFSSICNLRCQWCILDHSKPAEFLELKELTKIMKQIEVGELPNLERIELHNGGETLLHPKIDEALELIRDSKASWVKPIFITLLTNGTSLKEKTLQLLASGKVVDEIRISVDGGSIKNFEEIRKNAKWSKVSSNVKRFRKAINESSSKTKLGIICMVPKEKPDNIDWMEEEFKNVLLLADELEIRHPHSWEGSLPESTGLHANVSLKRPDRLCKFLKNDLVILASGKVTICCADLNGRGIVGDIASNSLKEILSGKERQNIIQLWQAGRFDEIPICSTCEGYYDSETNPPEYNGMEKSLNDSNLMYNEKLNIAELIKLLQSKLLDEAFCEAQILISKFEPALINNSDARILMHALTQKRDKKKKLLNWTVKESTSKTLHAEKLIEQHNLDEAKNVLLEVVNMDPFHLEALNDLAVVLILEENADDALEILNFILLNDNQNEIAIGNKHYLQTIQKEIKAPEIIFNKFTSYNEYYNHIQSNITELKEREVFESSILIDGDNSFTFEGYCAVCQKEVKFLVDYQYSNESNGIKIPNWRERLVCPDCELNNRMRLSIHLVEIIETNLSNSRVYIAEQTTQAYQKLKTICRELIGSEYIGNSVPFGTNNDDGIRNEDFTNLTFAKEEFDLVLSFDVFEHIYDYKKAFAEAFRVLKNGGSLLFTVPFNRNSEQNITRAKLKSNGSIEHLLAPEYHGDPMNTSDGCLCYFHFGWEMLNDLKEVGFDEAYSLFCYSKEYAYLGGDQIFFVAHKKV